MGYTGGFSPERGLARLGEKSDILDLSRLGNTGHLHPINPEIDRTYHSVTNVFPYGAVEISSESTNKIFKVNGHHLKPFLTNPSVVDEIVEEVSLVEPVFLPL
ncbi:hypothetical protein Lal_00000670 [Lupinus albus]|nr:hypothetical protein Lal_00000670 [Lupinus albus]